MIDRFKSAMSALGPFLGLAFVYLIFLCTAPDAFHSLYNTKTFFCHAVTIGIGAWNSRGVTTKPPLATLRELSE